jgi:hypothetical protein
MIWVKPRLRSTCWPAHLDYRDRYRAMATSLGFQGHIAMAQAMP